MAPPQSRRPAALPLLLALLVLVPALVSARRRRPTLATAKPLVVQQPLPTANSLHQDLLPADCGRRPVGPPSEYQQQIGGYPIENPAYVGQFPWHVRLVWRDERGQEEHRCSGLIITKWHVLTAADCVSDTQPSQLLVRVADVHITALDEHELDYAVTDFHVHHPRDGKRLADNVALLRLESPLEFNSHVQPACLPVADSDHAYGLPCEVAGWGRANSSDPVPDHLRSDAVPLASDQYCGTNEIFGNRFVPNRTICSGPNRRPQRHPCRGDAGAGLTCLDQPAGRVIAYGLLAVFDKQGCGSLAGIFAKLSFFTEWILCHVRFDQEGGAGQRPPLCGERPAPTCGVSNFIPSLDVDTYYPRNLSDLPWMAAVFRHQNGIQALPRCAGAVLSEHWILMSASCAEVNASLTVELGTLDVTRWNGQSLSAPLVSLSIAEIIRHPEYQPPNRVINDIALLRTATPIPLSSEVSAICLPDPEEVLAGTKLPADRLLVAGWGSSRVFYNVISLQWARVDVVDNDECISIYRREFYWKSPLRYFGPNAFCSRFPPSRHMCAPNPRGAVLMHRSTRGDLVRWQVVGMGHGDTACTQGQFPDINVAVAPSVEWIRNVTGL